jgi:hypothetical protein
VRELVSTFSANASEEKISWQRWLDEIGAVRQKFYQKFDDFDPLYYGETATVGLLANAAGRAGLLALPEFSEARIKRPGGKRLGRHDLWLVDLKSERSWLFEFKVCWPQKGTRKPLWQTYNHAIQCAYERPHEKSERKVAGVVYVPYGLYTRENFDALEDRMTAIRDHADVFCKFSGADRPAYLAMQMIDDGRRLSKYKMPEDIFDRS